LYRASFETSDGVRLCYAENLKDAPAASVLVFIPGWTMPAAIWARQLAHFSVRYPLIAFDPRGQGESAAPDTGYTLARRAEDIKELLDCFLGRRFVLIAWSLAVLEVLAYVDRHGADRLNGIVLVDNSIGEGPDSPAGNGENPFFAELRTRREATLRDFVDAIFRTPADPAIKKKVLASALKPDVEDSIRLLSHGRPRAYWRGIVQRLALPILYLVTPRYADQAALLERHHPQANTRIFEQAGHALFWDEPALFNETLEAFLDRLAVT
jgi:non-heme chloroperoxidase